ncbi:efflux RND transporter periplasmic adaptor subunit [Flammeovirga kamogawensis]|uniref:Biotin/lipoyl-binding protein n=1 Tax=Flammeovirga kamogawensis TaxID=373891 RepID=A0ABX8H2Z7_9BACT|nr:TolC family protein [Flammeovirga kamogawensis]MBB6460478.1 multidrug efflux pump subunit AcrA (membrane-fusion protein) [Flammeovirga kamogawensis]QWG10284.1 biotin/lipoyl-binding protein [Flammeovirga kamogawensis]TRX64732.1 biotin/lipoyl-binding protein [Flammeovirga kamogawensis]
MKKIIVLIIFSFLFLSVISCNLKKVKAHAKLLDIPVTQVRIKNIPIEKEFVGQVYGTQDIPIRARVEGYLDGIYFIEGSHVKEGQRLYKIDSEEYLATVAIRKGELAEAKVSLVKAKNDLKRDALASIQYYSEEELARQKHVNAARNAEYLSKERYDKGVTSYLEYLEQQRTAFDAELNYVTVKSDILKSYIQLYKSLGGGWKKYSKDE